MKKLTIYFLISILFSSPAFSQVFKGRVTAENGESIPYAAFYIHEISTGFTTDDEGYFHTVLAPGKYSCEVSSLGYTRQIIHIEMGRQDLERNIILNERVYQLKEVNITRNNEDPAYAVMRQVIGYAPYYRTYVKSYSAGTYLKGTGKIHKIPAVLKISKSAREDAKKYVGRLFLVEEQRRVKFTAPNSWDNEVLAYSNSFPDEMQITLETTNVNLYQPTIFGKVSPLSPGAFSYYRFKLEGFYTEGEHLVNKIRVIPRKDNPELISGYIYIIENLWCLSAVDITMSYTGFRAEVKVTCKEVKPGVFLNTSTTLKADIDMLGIKAEGSYLSAIHYASVDLNETTLVSAPEGSPKDNIKTADTPGKSIALTGKQQKIRQQIETLSKKDDLSTRDAYRLSKLVNKAIEEADTTRTGDKYERRIRAFDAKKDSLAGKRDSAYWAAVRSVPLKPEEVQSYVFKDKLKPLNDSLRSDTVRKMNMANTVIETLIFGKQIRTTNKKAWLTLGNLSSYIPEYNFVDGLWVGAKVTAGIKLGENSTLIFIPEAYYTTARKDWLGSGALTLDYAPRHVGKLTLSAGTLSADFNGESGENRLINAFSSIWFARNDMKFYDKRFLSIANEIEVTNGLLLTTGFTWQKRKALDNAVEKSIFKRHAKPNVPRHPDYQPMQRNELMKASVTLQYTPPRYYWMFRGNKIYENTNYPTLAFTYERAFAHGGTDKLTPSFHRTEFRAMQEIPFGLFNRFNWFVSAGAFWDTKDIQFPDFKHFATTRIPVTERSLNRGFSLLDNYAYSTHTRWAEANISWYTPYLLVKHLPFLKKKRFDEALHLRSLVTFKSVPYWEAGYSVGHSALYRLGVFAGFERLKFNSVGVTLSLPLLKLAGE